jgi:tetratricopeptide (TPR) repeat protein
MIASVVVLSLCLAETGQETGTREKLSGHDRMLALLREIKERAPEEHPNLSDRKARPLRERVAALGPDAPDAVQWELYLKAGEAEQIAGEEEQAIRYLSKAYELLPRVAPDLAPGWANRLRFRLGMSYLRLAEMTHHRLHRTPEDSIFPLERGGVHRDETLARQAIRYFTEQLETEVKGTPPDLAGRFLLNLAYMAAGGYPAQVPAAYLIPPDSFKSEEAFPRFPNLAQRAGVATESLAGGVVADDFDRDGDLDLLVSTHDPAGQLRLFVNDGRASFRERTLEAGLSGILGGLNMVQADYDNDGDVDVLLLRGAWLGAYGRLPKSLLRNNGDGTFTDLTFESGLGEVHYPSQTASWGDYDNDGNLDLYVGNETGSGLAAPCQLFHNRGDGTFLDLAPSAGVSNDRFTKAVIWGDYDGDRWMDLYVSNIDGANRLYRNDGAGRFSDVAGELGVSGPAESFAAWFWDFDNDGSLDLLVTAYDAQLSDIVAAALGRSFKAHLPSLYRGDGRGGFREVGAEYGLRRPSAPMGANFGDLDNDGYLDFYLGTGYMASHGLMPNVMYRNRSGRGFADVTTAGGFGHLQKGHGIAFADLDGDGDQDVFAQMGGALPRDDFDDALFENPGFGGHWLKVELVGVESNRSAIGARIRTEVSEGGSRRSIYRQVNSGGTFGANPLRQTIGLGKADRVERLEVFWPASNRSQTFRNLPLDRSLVIVEGVEGVFILP